MKNIIITNRENLGDKVAPNGALSYYWAELGSTDFQAYTAEEDCIADVVAELQASPNSTPQLGVFIHGFDSPWKKSLFGTPITTTVPQWFGNMRNNGYNDTLIAFDWPSNIAKLIPSGAIKYAQAMAEQTARMSFPLLTTVLQLIQKGLSAPAEISFLCHSMGNLLMQMGASYLPTSSPVISRTLLVAPELDSESFNSLAGKPAAALDIASATQESVTVYYNYYDKLLPKAEKYDNYNNGELGNYGPTFDNTLVESVLGVDTTKVNTISSVKQYDKDVKDTDAVHIGYFYLPVTLQDIVQTMLGIPHTNRNAAPEGGPQSFQLHVQ